MYSKTTLLIVTIITALIFSGAGLFFGKKISDNKLDNTNKGLQDLFDWQSRDCKIMGDSLTQCLDNLDKGKLTGEACARSKEYCEAGTAKLQQIMKGETAAFRSKELGLSFNYPKFISVTTTMDDNLYLAYGAEDYGIVVLARSLEDLKKQFNECLGDSDNPDCGVAAVGYFDNLNNLESLLKFDVGKTEIQGERYKYEIRQINSHKVIIRTAIPANSGVIFRQVIFKSNNGYRYLTFLDPLSPGSSDFVSVDILKLETTGKIIFEGILKTLKID